MTRYIVRRILGFIPVLFTVALFTFVLVRAIPGGPFDFAGERELPPQIVANIEAKYHLNWPTHMQFLSYLLGDDVVGAIFGGIYAETAGEARGLIRGDLGPSLRYRGQSVNDIVTTTLPVSFQLGVIALAIGLAIGLPAGIIAALKQNTWIDYSATFIAVLGVSIPGMVIGPLMIWLLAVKLGLFPAATWGAKPPWILGIFPSNIGWEFWSHALLPAIALGTGMSASIARLTRASLLQVTREDYIRTARAKGLRERAVIVVHALKNSLIPVITILGPLFAAVVTGTFVIEQIFGIGGMGKHFVQSIGNRDYPLIMGVTLVYTVLLVVANLVVDITYAWLDPRIRYD
ncbi:MAG: ABC transporter permease subunit [Anaerolineales bacterium]|nr:ABC transporter permease subunit [Anaerolineales bacterium]